jgi:hypothetical protein
MGKRRRLPTPLEKQIEEVGRQPATLENLLLLECLEEEQARRVAKTQSRKKETTS